MIKNITRLLLIGLSLSHAMSLESMQVQEPTNPASFKLRRAVEAGDPQAVEAALNAGANINYADSNGWTALMMAALHGHIDIVRLLIDAGAHVNCANNYDNSALMWAALYGHTEIVRLLLEQGADVNRANNYGDTALIWAARHGHEDIARMLMGHGARMPTEGDLQRFALQVRLALSAVFEGNELAYAAARGDTKRVVVLLSTPTQAQPQSPQTKSLIAQLRKLLASYAILPPMIPPQININHPDSHGMTALHWAAAQGYNDIIKLLLDFGANINPQNAQGNTPLHLAARNGNLSTVRLLLARGANVTMVNRQGQTPLALARQYHRSAIVDLLAREAGRAVFGRVSRAGRAGEFAWQPTPTGATLPPEIADIIAQFAQAPGHMPPSGSVS